MKTTTVPEKTNQSTPPPLPEPRKEPAAPAKKEAQQKKNLWPWIVAGIVLVVLLFWFVIRPRWMETRALDAAAAHPDAISVSVVAAGRAEAQTTLTLPGTVQAFQQATIYARTSGYLKRWLVDIGAHVKQGDLLAEIDTPEIDQQLREAQAALDQAKANLQLAKSSADRWQDLVKDNAVSQQEVDEKVSAYQACQADVEAAQANVLRLSETQAFQKIIAPFDGVITRRAVDNGDLVSVGNGTAGTQLFQIAQTDPLRVYIDVPQTYVGSVHSGIEAEVLPPEFHGKTFKGKVVRDARSVDPVSRTMRTEIDVPNPKDEILPGMYAQVKLILTQENPPLIVPSGALIVSAKGTQVAVVDSASKVHFHSVTVGRDFGATLEILQGLNEGEHVITNPSDALHEGMTVEVTPTKKAS